jgi:hypothetical protein
VKLIVLLCLSARCCKIEDANAFSRICTRVFPLYQGRMPIHSVISLYCFSEAVAVIVRFAVLLVVVIKQLNVERSVSVVVSYEQREGTLPLIQKPSKKMEECAQRVYTASVARFHTYLYVISHLVQYEVELGELVCSPTPRLLTPAVNDCVLASNLVSSCFSFEASFCPAREPAELNSPQPRPWAELQGDDSGGRGELERESSRWTGPFYRESANSASEPPALSSVLGGGLAITCPTYEPEASSPSFRRTCYSVLLSPMHALARSLTPRQSRQLLPHSSGEPFWAKKYYLRRRMRDK